MHPHCVTLEHPPGKIASHPAMSVYPATPHTVFAMREARAKAGTVSRWMKRQRSVHSYKRTCVRTRGTARVQSTGWLRLTKNELHATQSRLQAGGCKPRDFLLSAAAKFELSGAGCCFDGIWIPSFCLPWLYHLGRIRSPVSARYRYSFRLFHFELLNLLPQLTSLTSCTFHPTYL